MRGVLGSDVRMRIESSDPAALRGIFESIAVLQDEPRIKVTPVGLLVKCMDPSRVALLDMKVRGETFDLYSCVAERALTIDLHEALKILRRAQRDTKIVLEIQENTMEIEIRGRFLRRFSIPLIEGGEGAEIGEPNVEYTARATLMVDDLIEMLGDAALSGDYVKVEVDESLLRISSKGDTGSAKVEVARGSDALLSIEASRPASAYFSLSYLTNITKAASKVADTVEIHLTDNMPIKMDFRTKFAGELKYYIAPRIEE